MTNIYLDHALIAVRSLSAAAKLYSSLGFKVTPEGRHPGRGTHNRLIVFGPEYLELIAVHDPGATPFRPGMTSFLESREGLYMFALGTSDLDRAVAEIRSRGVGVADPVPGRREASETPGYTWRSANLGDALPGTECFLIQHDHTVAERYTQPPDPARHPNGVTGIRRITLAVQDAESSADRWQAVLGMDAAELPPATGQERWRLALGNACIDLVSPTEPGPLADFIRRHGEAPYELALETPDIGAAGADMRRRGVPHRAAPDAPGALIEPAHAAGARLRLEQA